MNTPSSTSAKRGRPAGSRNRQTIARELARSFVTITVNDVETRVSLAKALIERLRQHALHDVAAARFLNKIGSTGKQKAEQLSPCLLLVPEPMSEAEWIRRQGSSTSSASSRRCLRGTSHKMTLRVQP